MPIHPVVPGFQCRSRSQCPYRCRRRPLGTRLLFAALTLVLVFTPVPASLSAQSDTGVTSGTPALPDEPVRVAVLNNFPPFAFTVRGKLMGFTVDYVQLLAEKVGIEIELVPGTWENNFQRFRNGRVDVITAISYTERRQEFTRYTDPYYRIPTVVYTREGDFSYEGVLDLRDRTVGIEAGVYYREYLEDYPSITIREIADTGDLMRELSFGGVDAVLTNINIGDYMIKKHVLENVGLAGGINIDAIANEDLRIGVRREITGLRGLLQSAMDRITPQEYTQLQERWVGFTPPSMAQNLTPGESETLADHVQEHGEVRMAVHPAWYPLDFLNEEGTHRGVSADLFGELSERYDIPFTSLHTDSFEASVTAVTEGRAEILPAVVPTPQLRDKLIFSKPYLSLDMVIATRNSEFFVDGPENLGGRRVGIVDMGTLPESLSQKYPDISLQSVESVEEGLRRVSAGEDFAFIGTVPTIAYAIKEHSFYNIKIAGRLEESRAVSVAAAPENHELLTVVEKGLQGMSLEARRRAVDRWISISLEEQVDRTTLWLILAGVLVAGALAAAWIRKTQSYNRKLSAAYTLLEKKNRELAELSITDRLTGLFNRTKLDHELQREVARSNRYEAPLSLIMIDVDWFKQINDELGHQVGDQVLQEIANVLSRRVRTADIVGRWGGEEFLVICPETTRAGACELAESLRCGVADELVASSRPVTISLGVSQHSPGTTAGDAIRRSDERLYRAKETGKNNVQAE